MTVPNLVSRFAGTRSSFLEWVHKAFRRRMRADLAVEEYLVLLLEEHLRQDAPGSVAVSQPLTEFVKSFSKVGMTRLARIRQVGDASLFTAGVLGPHLGRSLLRLEHYVEVGESAYQILRSHLPEGDKYFAAYRCFANGLGPFVAILNEVSTEHIFPGDLQSIMFVFDRYMAIKDPEDARWLLEHGVVLLETHDSRKIVIS